MRRTFSFIIVVPLLLNCTYGTKQYEYFDYERKQALIISKHMGETVEPEEREQFGIFPGISDFKAARLYEIKGGGYVVKIITEHEKLITVNRDPNGINILRDYINRYEEIQKSRATFEKKWKIAGYDDLGQPITQDEINRVKRSDYTVGCGSSCCLLGLTSLLFMSEFSETARAFGGSVNYEPFYYAIGATLAGTIAGALEGHRQDKNNALKKIKEARKPRIVE